MSRAKTAVCRRCYYGQAIAGRRRTRKTILLACAPRPSTLRAHSKSASVSTRLLKGWSGRILSPVLRRESHKLPIFARLAPGIEAGRNTIRGVGIWEQKASKATKVIAFVFFCSNPFASQYSVLIFSNQASARASPPARTTRAENRPAPHWDAHPPARLR